MTLFLSALFRILPGPCWSHHLGELKAARLTALKKLFTSPKILIKCKFTGEFGDTEYVVARDTGELEGSETTLACGSYLEEGTEVTARLGGGALGNET